MMARVSTAARDSRLFCRSRWRRRRTGASSDRVTRRTPPATSTTAIPRPGASHARPRASTARRVSSAEISSTSATRSSGNGASEAKRRASKAARISGLTGGLLTERALDDDLAEQLPLLGARLLEAHQLEDREQRDHGLRAWRVGPEESGEEDIPAVLQDPGDLGHPLEERRPLGSDLPDRLRLRFPGEEGPVGLGQVPEAQGLEGEVLGQRQLAPRPDKARRPCRLAIPQPLPQLLDAGVGAEAGLELLAERLGVVGERLLLDLGRGQEQLGLEVDQGRGEDEERACLVELGELH